MEVCVVPAPREGRENMTQQFFSESLILAQNERWQRGLGMHRFLAGLQVFGHFGEYYGYFPAESGVFGAFGGF